MNNESKISRDERAGIASSSVCGGIATGSTAVNIVYNTGLGLTAGVTANIAVMAFTSAATCAGGLAGYGLFKLVKCLTADDGNERQYIASSYGATNVYAEVEQSTTGMHDPSQPR